MPITSATRWAESSISLTASGLSSSDVDWKSSEENRQDVRAHRSAANARRLPLPHRHAGLRRRPRRGGRAGARGGARRDARRRRSRRGAGPPPCARGGARYRLPATAGVHPHEARLGRRGVYDELRGLAREGRIVAIGEIGLDFHYDHSPRDAQREAFRRQLRLAREVGLPVVVHTREADDETAAILEEEGAGETGGVIHCFTGGARPRPAGARARVLHLVLGDRRVPAGGDDPAGRARDARRPAPRRDGRAVPRAASAPRQAQRAGLRRRGGAEGRGAARGRASRRCPRPCASNYARLFRRAVNACAVR